MQCTAYITFLIRVTPLMKPHAVGVTDFISKGQGERCMNTPLCSSCTSSSGQKWPATGRFVLGAAFPPDDSFLFKIQMLWGKSHMNCWSYYNSVRKIMERLGDTKASMQLAVSKSQTDCWMENFLLFLWLSQSWHYRAGAALISSIPGLHQLD